MTTMTRNVTAIINRDHALGSAYPVSLDAFDGPLDLLLQLIERNELDISEVSLCAVTDQYLETLDKLADVEPDALADFLASCLALCSTSNPTACCPDPHEQEDEEEDTGDALIRQLIEYRRFRQAADELRARSDSGQSVHVRPVTKASPDRNFAAPPDLSEVSADDLQAMLARALQRIPVEAAAASRGRIPSHGGGANRTCARLRA